VCANFTIQDSTVGPDGVIRSEPRPRLALSEKKKGLELDVGFTYTAARRLPSRIRQRDLWTRPPDAHPTCRLPTWDAFRRRVLVAVRALAEKHNVAPDRIEEGKAWS
jgi:hypothetical protein